MAWDRKPPPLYKLFFYVRLFCVSFNGDFVRRFAVADVVTLYCRWTHGHDTYNVPRLSNRCGYFCTGIECEDVVFVKHNRSQVLQLVILSVNVHTSTDL